MRNLLLFLIFPLAAFSQHSGTQEMTAWQSKANRVTIIRDRWGVPHIYGKSDADAVFGLMYAQCEDDFPRVERNYLEMLGRLSEIEGRGRLYDDLRMQLIYDTSAAKKEYVTSPVWLRSLLDAFADGINFYLAKHPDVQPKVLKHFEPWFPLLFTDGSISATQTGGLTDQDVRELYFPGQLSSTFLSQEDHSLHFEEYCGSNG